MFKQKQNNNEITDANYESDKIVEGTNLRLG